MKEVSENLLKEVNWHGVGMVEFKIEKDTGIPYFIEVNGRFWGSLQLAIDSGVDFPYLLYCIATNSNLELSNEYLIGTKSRWLLGDLDYLYFRILKKEGNEGFPKDFRSKVKAIFEFFKYNGRHCSFEVINIRDIKPFIVELKDYVRELSHN